MTHVPCEFFFFFLIFFLFFEEKVLWHGVERTFVVCVVYIYGEKPSPSCQKTQENRKKIIFLIFDDTQKLIIVVCVFWFITGLFIIRCDEDEFYNN